MSVDGVDISGFYWIRLRAFFDVEEELVFSAYPGSALRGAFGHNLRSMCCFDKNAECSDCVLESQCAYRAIFKPAPPDDFLSSYSVVPPPYVVEPSLGKDVTYSVGETLSFSIVLIGQAIDYTPYVILALQRFKNSGLGRGRARVRLREVQAVGVDSDRVIYDGESKTVDISEARVSGSDLIRPRDSIPDGPLNLRIHFPVMTRLKSKGELIRHPSFEVVARSLMRRASMLGRIHCGLDVNWPFGELTEAASNVMIEKDETRWFDWTRHSSRQRGLMKFGGIYGTVTYRGVPGAFVPLLALGEYIHVGKNTTFGLGAMRVTGVEK